MIGSLLAQEVANLSELCSHNWSRSKSWLFVLDHIFTRSTESTGISIIKYNQDTLRKTQAMKMVAKMKTQRRGPFGRGEVEYPPHKIERWGQGTPDHGQGIRQENNVATEATYKYVNLSGDI